MKMLLVGLVAVAVLGFGCTRPVPAEPDYSPGDLVQHVTDKRCGVVVFWFPRCRGYRVRFPASNGPSHAMETCYSFELEPYTGATQPR